MVCDFFDLFVSYICPRDRKVEIVDGSLILLLQKLLERILWKQVC